MNSKFHSPFFFGGEHIKLTIAEPECVHLLPFPSIKGDISHSVNAVIPLLVIFGVFWIYGHQIIMFLLPYNLNWANVTVSFSYLLSPLQIEFCIIEAQTFSFIDSPINYLKCLWKHLVLH